MSVRMICKLGIAIGLANYGLYVLACFLLGGDAIQGHVVSGHYLIQEGASVIEVSRVLFRFSQIAAYGLIATFPLGLLCACFLGPRSKSGEPELGFGIQQSWTAEAQSNGR